MLVRPLQHITEAPERLPEVQPTRGPPMRLCVALMQIPCTQEGAKEQPSFPRPEDRPGCLEQTLTTLSSEEGVRGHASANLGLPFQPTRAQHTPHLETRSVCSGLEPSGRSETRRTGEGLKVSILLFVL